MAREDLGGLLSGESSGRNVLGALLGALGGGNSGGGGNPLPGLIDMLDKAGLREQTRSWIGHGANQPVSGAQLAKALPPSTLQQVAQQVGATLEEAAEELAYVLPQAVDDLTPAGELPQAALADEFRQQEL
ncbi:hypothetical protein GCM10020367_12800 [Streptomyces sannanensis]|uniref:DUF937 domain-containing protein n=1 Tax=Streptomyces sannanensis TaxID=285536 RepID=A0ABP6S6Q7_9ACTN